MKTIKRILSLLLALVLLAGCLSAWGLASEGAEESGGGTAEASEEPGTEEEAGPDAYPVLSSVEDTSPEALFSPEEIAAGLLEQMSTLTDRAEVDAATEADAETEDDEAADDNAETEDDAGEEDVVIPEEIAGMDFSSRRILVSGGDAADSPAALASYDDVALLQFETEAEAMEAYAYYAETDAAVEIDAAVVIADDVVSIEAASVPAAEMTEDDNPLTALGEILEDPSAVDAVNAKLIAVIDTGASAGPNVCERYSVLGDYPGDDNGHGDAMIAAITAVNPDAVIISVKALDAYGHGSASTLYAAIRLAIELHADIINLSVYANKTDESAVVVGAIGDAVAAGITVIGAAGNSAGDAANYVPGCVSAAVIAGSVTEERVLQPFSNYGATVDYYVESGSTSEAAAIVTGYYSLANADFSNIASECVYRLEETVSPYAALTADDFVIAWSGWPINVTRVTDIPVGVVRGRYMLYATGSQTYLYNIVYDGTLADYTTESAADAYGYCVDAEDDSMSYDATYIFEVNIADYPVLAAAAITAPAARTKNGADEIFADLGVDLDAIWAPLHYACFASYVSDDASAHALLCYLFQGGWTFQPMNWTTTAILSQRTALEEITANLFLSIVNDPDAYNALTTKFRVYVVSRGLTSSYYQRHIFAVGVEENGGALKLIKSSDDGNVSGITFTVTNDATGESLTAVTGEDGTFLIEGLEPGTYTVTETEPYGYVSPNPVKTVTVVEGDTTRVRFVNKLKTFCVSFRKVDAETGGEAQNGAVLSGAVYGLYKDGEEAARYTTDEDGRFTSDYFPCGTGWTLREITPPAGYLLDETEYPIPAEIENYYHSKNTITMGAADTVIKGSIRIVKVDEDTRTPLSGAVYAFYDSAGELVTEETTDEDGLIVLDELPYGAYTYQETVPPEGYELDDTVWRFTIRENAAELCRTRTNARTVGSITVLKTDANGRAVAGVTYLLQYSTDGGGTWAPVFSIGETDTQTPGGCRSAGLSNGRLVTNSAGGALFEGLYADGEILYRLTEADTVNGYTLLAGPVYEGTLPVDDDGDALFDITATIRETHVFGLPETGGDGFHAAAMVLACVLLSVGLCLLSDVIGKNREDI